VRRSFALAALGFALGCSSGADPGAPEASTKTAAATEGNASSAATASSEPSAPVANASAAPRSSATPAASGAPPAAPPEGMVAIPAGYFLMGSPRGTGNPEEHPAHERAVGAFYMDTTEVTVGAYRACVEAGICAAPRKTEHHCNDLTDARAKRPVNCIDWNDAVAYCKWKDERLPTEAEWEYAAQGGAEGRTFSWGEENPSHKNACFDAPDSCDVGSFPPGAFGLYDMCGNVWEWTSTWAGAFSPTGAASPAEAKDGTRKIFKGGSFSRRWPKWLRVKNRAHWKPTELGAWLGFRCVRGVEPIACPDGAEPEDGVCTRVRGEPMCEHGMKWNGEACNFVDAHGVPEPGRPAAEVEPPALDPDEPVTMDRTPKDDGDCIKNYPGKPAAYRWTGATWEARVKLVSARGCTRRDNSRTWVSACCKG
jgi:formylglycine-generating enzyme required for sulfatase activity